MSVVWIDGFDHYGLDEDMMADGVYADVVCQLSTAQARQAGGTSLYMGGNAFARLRKVLPGNRQEVAWGAAYYLLGLPQATHRPVVSFCDDQNVVNCCVEITTTGAIIVYRGAGQSQGGVVLGQSAPVIVSNAWNHIEVIARIGDADGRIRVAVNNALVLDVNNVDTRNAGNHIAQVRCQLTDVSATPNWAEMYIDDLFIRDDQGDVNNAGFLGDRQCLLLKPNADTAVEDWGRTSGADSFALVDESSANDAGFLSATAAGQKTKMGLTDLPPDITNVAAVMTFARQRKTDAGVATTQVSMFQGVAEDLGAERPITTEFTYWTDMFEKDPATGVLWTPAGVNSAQVQIERVA